MSSSPLRLLVLLLLGACSSSSPSSSPAKGPPPPDPDNCFSPTRNVDAAYEPGAVGCACNSGQPYVCVEDTTGWRVPLRCVEGRWQASTKVEAEACRG